MKTAKEIFDSLPAADTFQRVGRKHPLDLYCGYDHLHRHTLLLISTAKPDKLYSSKVIDVNVSRRMTDDKWALSFSLADNDFKELFHQFCDDMIDASQTLRNPICGSNFLCSRYISWQEMLSTVRSGVLSRPEIKGLIGEMLFLRDKLIPKYGRDVSLQAWMGPKMADQDFVFPDRWYEIKTTKSGAEEVQITSIEQLDCTKEGTLVVLTLDRTSSIDEQRVTVNTLFQELMHEMGEDSLQTDFRNLLLKLGFYPRPEYDEFIYRLNGIRQYRVDQEFPCLRRANLPASIKNATWILALPAIKSWLKESSLNGCE